MESVLETTVELRLEAPAEISIPGASALVMASTEELELDELELLELELELDELEELELEELEELEEPMEALIEALMEELIAELIETEAEAVIAMELGAMAPVKMLGLEAETLGVCLTGTAKVVPLAVKDWT